MTIPISQFYPLLLALWAMVFWCKSRVFRTTLLISLALHAVFLVRVIGWGRSDATREEILVFTFVQGGEEEQKGSSEEGIGLSPGRSTTERDAAQQVSQPDREAPEEPEKEPPPPEKTPVEEELPPLEDTSLLDASASPLAESYRKQLQSLVRRHRKPTPPDLEEDFEARVRIWFNLSSDGTLNPSAFVDTRIRSSHGSVNQAALGSVIAAAEHFPSFPKGIDRAEMWFHIDVDFGPVRFPGD